MHPIIFKRVVRTAKRAAGRPVAGKAVMKTVNHSMDSDLITNVAEGFVEHHTPAARAREWPDVKKPPEKLSEITFVENEILRTIEDVLDSVEIIHAKIYAAQTDGKTVGKGSSKR